MSNPFADETSTDVRDRLSSPSTGESLNDVSSGDTAAVPGDETDATLPGADPDSLTQSIVGSAESSSSTSLPPWEQSSTTRSSTSTTSTSSSSSSTSSTSTTSSSTTETTQTRPTSVEGNPVGNGSSDDLVTFNSTNWVGEERNHDSHVHIFDIDDGKRKFGWAIRDMEVELTKVSLLGHDETKEKQTDFDVMNRVIFQGKPAQIKDRRRADEDDDIEVVKILSDGGGIEIDMKAFGTGNITNYRAKQMAVMLDWKHDGKEGFTRSAAFTVYDPSNNTDKGWIADYEGLLEQDKNADLLQALEETTFPDAAARTSSAGDESDEGGGGGGSRGLSTAAIAGIGVAAGIAFLVIVGGLILFLLRRRRQKKSHAGYDNPAQDSGAFIASNDKELHHVTESPHSTFSHDQQQQQQQQQQPAIALGGASPGPQREHSPRRSEGEYSPYRDDGSGMGQTRNTDTPQGVPSSVAHLVEDGMTPDEIRRLEEEERQLDDAIERRGRR